MFISGFEVFKPFNYTHNGADYNLTMGFYNRIVTALLFVQNWPHILEVWIDQSIRCGKTSKNEVQGTSNTKTYVSVVYRWHKKSGKFFCAGRLKIRQWTE